MFICVAPGQYLSICSPLIQNSALGKVNLAIVFGAGEDCKTGSFLSTVPQETIY